MITIIPIPALKDNYIWLLKKPKGTSAYVVDPGDANPVLEYLREHRLNLCGVLITHHHWDHTNGLPVLLDHYPNIPVYGPAQETVSGVTLPLQEGNTITLPELETSFNIIDIPGHTLGHIAYHNEKTLFCGDTLFASGCGRIFEGTPEMMYKSLAKLKNLPNNLLVYCAHEYTEANIQFALHVEANNTDLKQRLVQVQKQRQANQPSLPVLLGDEKKMNPFLRCDNKAIQEPVMIHSGLKTYDPASIFAELRLWKDSF